MKTRQTVIIGAGIVGSYTALHLSGHRTPDSITVVDRAPFSYDNTSCVNMGGFATSEVYPLARPRNVWRAIKWLPNPQAPLALRMSYLPGLLPWLRVFLRSAASRKHFQRVVTAQQALMKNASSAHTDSLCGTGLEELISGNGTICLYKTDRRFTADWNSRWRLFRGQGYKCHQMSAAELHGLLPDLAADVRYGIWVPDIKFWTEPAALLRGLHNLLGERGVKFETAEVSHLGCESNGELRLEFAAGSGMTCYELIVAAGAYSKALCRDLGDDVPLDTERGYSTTLPDPGVAIEHLLLLVEDDFVATPMQSGLRLGGTVELAGLEAAPNFKRVDVFADRMQTYFPGLNTSGRTDRIGFRPSMPDGLPVISRSSRYRNAFYAFGHGHVGMTQSAVTGQLIRQLLMRQETSVDLRPYSVSRFSRRRFSRSGM